MYQERGRIQLKVNYGEESLGILVKKNQKLQKSMYFVCNQFKQVRNNSKFYFNNALLTGDETPISVNLVENDCITMLTDIEDEEIGLSHFEFLKVLGKGGYGVVYLVRKTGGKDNGKLYAMKVLEKSKIEKSARSIENLKTERKVLEKIGRNPFLAMMHYAFETKSKLYLALGKYFSFKYSNKHIYF